MNRVFKSIPAISRVCARQLTTTEVKCKKPDLSKIKKKQTQFQIDNDIPVHLKGGPADYVLYYSTVVMVFSGVALCLHSTYKLMTKK